jgi:hypothetical protein
MGYALRYTIKEGDIFPIPGKDTGLPEMNDEVTGGYRFVGAQEESMRLIIVRASWKAALPSK